MIRRNPLTATIYIYILKVNSRLNTFAPKFTTNAFELLTSYSHRLRVKSVLVVVCQIPTILVLWRKAKEDWIWWCTSLCFLCTTTREFVEISLPHFLLSNGTRLLFAVEWRRKERERWVVFTIISFMVCSLLTSFQRYKQNVFCIISEKTARGKKNSFSETQNGISCS